MSKRTYHININRFYEKFGEIYEDIYDSRDQYPKFDWAVKEFDENLMKKHKDFVMEFVEFRGDMITSDREAAAFTFTLLWFVLGKELAGYVQG